MKTIYLLLTILGIVLPFSQFIPWLVENGFHFPLLLQQIVENPLATFAWLDVILTVIVIVFMVVSEGKKIKMRKLWIPIVASFIGGASIGLPLFLYMKECHFENKL